MNKLEHTIIVYTDGSCHTQLKNGAWASIILNGTSRELLSGKVLLTTHNRMELVAVINSIVYIEKTFSEKNYIKIYTDSQYVVKLPQRIEKLKAHHFMSANGKMIQNHDLVMKLADLIDRFNIDFIKVKAHQKSNSSENLNREVDIVARKLAREMTNNP